MMDFIVKYWAQLTVVIGAVMGPIAYISKGFWDYRYKRMEIKHNLFFKERLDAISNFFALYKKMEDSLAISVMLKKQKKNSITLSKALVETIQEFNKAYQYALLLVSPKIQNSFKLLYKNIYENSVPINAFIEEDTTTSNTSKMTDEAWNELRRKIVGCGIEQLDLIVKFTHKEYNVR